MAAPEDWITICNEFTAVRVRKVHTRNGERLAIESAKLGHAVELDALELESLSWQTAETFSRLLETPYGPEDDAGPGGALSDLLDPGPSAPRTRASRRGRRPGEGSRGAGAG